MRLHPLAAIAFTVSCATLASAQNPASRATGASPSPPPSQAGDMGFFRPAADPNLTAPRPEERAQASGDRSRAPDPVPVLQWSERQMDRSEHEAERAKPAPGTPAPINGAFTGSTNPRDR